MRLLQAMIKLCISIMVTALVCVVCTFTVMNAYLDMVLDQYALKSTTLTAPNWSQFMAHLGKQAEGYRLFHIAKADTAGGGTAEPKTIPAAQQVPEEDAIAVFGQQKESGNPPKMTGSDEADSGAGGKVVVSGEEFTKKKEQLTNDDKNQIFKLLTRVPQPDIQRISQMMEDGITANELNRIEQLLQNYLKPEEYSQLLGMIKPR